MSESPIQTKQKHILFLFSGATDRSKIFADFLAGKSADTPLRGANHLPDAEWLDVESTVRKFLPQSIYRLLPWQARSVLLFPRVRRYDVVIAQDDLPLGWLIWLTSHFSRKRVQWIMLAVNTSVLIRRHTHHAVRFFILKLFLKSCTKIVCISHAQVADLTRIGIPSEKLVFVPFGVDAQFYSSELTAQSGNYILSVGRDLGRDYQTLFEVAKQIAHEFVIVADYKNIPKGTPLPHNVSVRYNLSPQELQDLYTEARLVVIPSKPEGTHDGSDCSGQTVILDAMAAGKTVITTDRVWIKDYFSIGKEIITVPPVDASVLVSAINRVWDDAGERERIAKAGQTKVQNQYTTKQFAQSLRKLLDTERG